MGRLESSVNLGPWGNPDSYFVSLDLSRARHPQTLLATHLNGKPLTVEHGAPLRLVAPVKLGLKNIKAITRITYTKDEPADYWAKRGYHAITEFESLPSESLRGGKSDPSSCSM